MSDVEQLREIAGKLGKNDRMELRLAIDFAEDEDARDGAKIETISMNARRRQGLQRLGLVERIPGSGTSHTDRQRCHLTELGAQVAKLLVEDHEAWVAERTRIKREVGLARKRLKDAGRWDELVDLHPILKTKTRDASEKRLDEMHALMMTL